MQHFLKTRGRNTFSRLEDATLFQDGLLKNTAPKHLKWYNPTGILGIETSRTSKG